VIKRLAVRGMVALVVATGCALAAGCLGPNPNHPAAGDPAVQTGNKPPAAFTDYDRHASRVVVRPDVGTARVGAAQVFIATVYDADGHPRPKRRVEWIVEGPGTIIEVDESGYVPGRGITADHKYAMSETGSAEHHITRGRDDFGVGPGQTWCVVKSAVEGETTVIAHCPAISDTKKNRASGTVSWVEGDLAFPAPVTTRAGGDYTLTTVVPRSGGPSAGYRVRYRILDGPPAALTADAGEEVSSVTEAVAPVDDDGSGRVTIKQPLPAPGINRISIEVVKADPDRPGQVTVVSKGQTRVTWQAPQLTVTVATPTALGLNQDATVTYTVSASERVEGGSVTLSARLPDGLTLIRTEPPAAVDGDTLVWTVPAESDGKPASVQAIVRPDRVGSVTLAAEVRTEDGLTGRGSIEAKVAETKLLLKVDGPASALVGDILPFRIIVTNAGGGPAEQVRVHVKLDEGLEAGNKSPTFDETIATLGPGQSKTIPLPVLAARGGKVGLQASAAAQVGGKAAPQTATVEVKEAQLALSAHGPAREYLGRQVNWQLVVRNNGDVALGNVVVKASLPPEVSFVKATDGGKVVGKQVVWDLGTAPAGQERAVVLTAVCNNATNRATLTATATAAAGAAGDTGRPAAKAAVAARPADASLEIVGLPALQLSVKGPTESIGVGQRTTYAVRVKNAGTQAARDVRVTAEVPSSMRPKRATGPGQVGKIVEEKEAGKFTVTFPPIDSLAPNAEATFVIEAEPLMPGDVRSAFGVRSASQAQALHAEETTKVLGTESRPSDR
jgi:uncharacterized repeat protein (TIGR01451 family)